MNNLGSPNDAATSLIHVTYPSIVSVFWSKWKDLHTWNNCSLVCPIFEYWCLNCFFKPFPPKAIGLSDLYHNLSSPTKVRQNICILIPSGSAWVSIQSLVLRRCDSTSSSDLPANSGLKWDQFNCGTGPGWTGGITGCVGRTTGCAGVAGSCTGGTVGTTGGVTGVAEVWVLLHQPYLCI